MSNILNDLGIDPEDFSWMDVAVCQGMDHNLFYDTYENDINIAKNIDEMCLSCPVVKMCYDHGIANDEQGVWGGIYIYAGAIDKQRNMHKTPEVWKRLKKKHVY